MSIFLSFYVFSTNHSMNFLVRRSIVNSTVTNLSWSINNTVCLFSQSNGQKYYSEQLDPTLALGFRSKRYLLWKDPLKFKKTYDLQNTKQYIESINENGIVIEPKIDGFACLLNYKNGKLTRVLTKRMKIIRQNYHHFSNPIPTRLNKSFNGYIRGELVVTWQDFHKVNKNRKLIGIKTYKTPLDMLKSFLMKKKTNPDICECVRFYGYYIGFTKQFPRNIKSQLDIHLHLEKIGIKSLKSSIKTFEDSKKAMNYIRKVKKNPYIYPTPIDGITVKILNHYDYRRRDASLVYCFKLSN